MAKSSSGFFFWFIFLCLVLGGFLFWKKHCRATSGSTQSGISTPNSEGQDSLKGIITPDEACYLLYCDVDKRAEEMHKRTYPEQENKKDKSIKYHFYDSSTKFSYGGDFSFFNHQDYYIITFSGAGESGEKGRDAFISGFLGKEKMLAINDCKEGMYKISDRCFACDMGFKREARAYVIIIMRAIEFSRTENRLPKVKKPQKGSGDEMFDESIL